MTKDDSLGEILNEIFNRLDIGRAVIEAIGLMRKLYNWQETPNHVIYMTHLPKYLSNDNKDALNKFISKQVKKDIMSGEFVTAFFFLKNWLGLTDKGARDVFQDILVTTFNPGEEDVSKAFLAKKNLIDPYFNRLESSMFGRRLNEATLHSLRVQGYTKEDSAADRMMEIFRLLDMRNLKPTSQPVIKMMSHISRNRIKYQDAVIVESEGKPQYDKKAARKVIPPNLQQKLDKAAGVSRNLANR